MAQLLSFIQVVTLSMNIGVFATFLSQKDVHVAEETCVMSFVIPREKVKNSCQIEERVKQRMNRMETKLNMYRREVSQLQGHLQKERQLFHDRLQALEAKMTTFNPTNYQALEKKLENMEIVLKKGSETLEPVDRRYSDVAINKGGTFKTNLLHDNENLENLVKPIVISEIENYLENFTRKSEGSVKNRNIENNEIMDMWPRNDQSYAVDEDKNRNISKTNVMIQEIENLQNKLNQTGDALASALGKILKNITIKGNSVLYRDNVTQSLNSSQNSDQPKQSWEVTHQMEKASSRISGTEGGSDSQNDQQHVHDNLYVANVYSDELEELLRLEINNLLQSHMEEVINLMRKQSVKLVTAVDEQGKDIDKIEEGHEEMMKRLQDRVDGIKLELSSISQAVQEFYAKMEKMQSLQVIVEEIKKNMSSMSASRNQEMVSKVDEHGKKLRTLDRLRGIFQQSLQHYRNESKMAYTDMQHKLASLEVNLAQELSSELYSNITSQFNRQFDRFDNTLKSRSNSMETAVRNLEDNSVLLQMDIKNLERRHKSKTGKLEEDYRNLKNRVDRVLNQNRKLVENVNSIKGEQASLQTWVNTTSITLDSLGIEFRLSVTDTWVEYDFDYDTSRTACFGKQYVRKTKYKNARLAGVVLCNNNRYKIMLANCVREKFLNVGDINGFGEDHCEFVGTTKSSEILLSPPAISAKTEEGFARDSWGQEPRRMHLNFLRPSPAWYECGVQIP
ncbi:putative leucine-rich repeat-containing protein DDB_G0290503 [Haliotis asinina]|uniref:putative leucine-rich repeat-containing protein DDB_G0290503 n=1 Tax=Haliotis asinina TaxID=109174 RepID=UPI003531F1FF